jgi:hypothetical protein
MIQNSDANWTYHPVRKASRQLGRAAAANPAWPGFPWAVLEQGALALAGQAADVPAEPAGVPATSCVAKIS